MEVKNIEENLWEAYERRGEKYGLTGEKLLQFIKENIEKEEKLTKERLDREERIINRERERELANLEKERELELANLERERLDRENDRDLARIELEKERLRLEAEQAYKSVVKSSIDGPKYCQPLSLPSLSSNAPMFPPCMNQLMKVLRQCHRLKHHDRIQLTLFLKELGLPLHDALLLWKHEYSKHDSVGSHKGWVGNEKRYIYNIRHLYGLEGGRINYRAHSCHFIQGRSLTLGDYGGCPFVVKDKTVLSSLTEEMGLGLHDIPVFERLIESQDYTAACQLYMLLKKLLMVKEDNFKSTQNNHFREQANKNGSVFQEHKVDNTPHTSIKLCCTQPGKDQRAARQRSACSQAKISVQPGKDQHAASAHKHSINHSVFLNSADGNVEMMYDNLKSSKLKSCSCTLENDKADKLSGSTIDIALKIRLSKSYTHPDDVSPDDSSLTEPNCCPDDLLTAGHSSHTSALIKKTLATETSVDDTLCCEPRDVNKGRHIQLLLGRHAKPSECFWTYQNRECLLSGGSSHGKM
ncbi:hypothetical protein Btru_036233 [Bulinus truncatus]|nr:hypothetical protein Btru_036233 [Bulinus truncatus]